MDLLSSIMNKMEKPPVVPVSKEKQEQQRKHQESLKKMQQQEKDKWKQFRSDIESSVQRLQSEETLKSLEFPPMDKTRRQVIHDVIDATGDSLVSHSFGIEDIDRHVVVYKSNHVPCDDELACLRRGEVYDPVKIEEERKRKQLEDVEDRKRKKGRETEQTNSNYKDKYSHLIGKEAGISAAAATVTNKSYGYVSAENKKDQRSIEQTLKDIREKKRIKMTMTHDEGKNQDDLEEEQEESQEDDEDDGQEEDHD